MRRPQVVEAGGWYGSLAFHFPNIQTAEEGDPEARFFAMKNRLTHLRTLLAVMLCALMSVAFTACGDDDDEPGDTSKVVGTWYGEDYDHFYSNVSITFNSDGTGSATMERNGAYLSVYRAQFTYKVKGNKVTTPGTMANANSDGETSTQDFNNTYDVAGTTLYVRSGNSWYTGNVRSYHK